jgi:carboxypeptidase PM20D1
MKMSWWKKFFAAAMAAFVILVVVVVARSALVSQPQAPMPPPPVAFHVDAMQAAERLAGAIRIPTVSEQEAGKTNLQTFIELHAYIERAFPKVHAVLKREVVGEYSLLYTWQGQRNDLKPIAVLAHMDVSPAEVEKSLWTHPPFEGRIAEGFVWGRGTLDMKHGVIASLEAVETLLREDFRPLRTIYLAFGHDEEIGGRRGARQIAKTLAERGVRLGLTIDEGQAIVEGIMPGVAKPVALVGLAEKGYLTLELAVTGEGGHSSMPHSDMAVVRLARAIERLERNSMPATLQAPVTWMFDRLAPEMSFAYRTVFANRWLFEPLLLSQLARQPGPNALIRTTTAPTMLSAGAKENAMPTTARAHINFRLLAGQTFQGVIDHVRAVISDPKIEIKVAGEPWEAGRLSRMESFGYTVIERTIRQVYPEVVIAPSLTVGATDSIHYAAIADESYRFIPMRLKSGDLKRIHGIDERIAVADYARMVSFYAALIRNSGITEPDISMKVSIGSNR